MSERETTTDLVKRLEAGETGRGIDAEICVLLNLKLDGSIERHKFASLVAYEGNVLVSYGGRASHRYPAHPLTTSRETAAKVISILLPNWWYSSGYCHLTCHASLGPDHSDPASAERLNREFPPEHGTPYDSGFDADIPQPTTEAAALMHCLLQAVAYNKEHKNADRADD